MKECIQHLIDGRKQSVARKAHHTPAGLRQLGELCKAACKKRKGDSKSTSLAEIVRQLVQKASFQGALISARQVSRLWSEEKVDDWVRRFEKDPVQLHAMHFRFIAELPPERRPKP